MIFRSVKAHIEKENWFAVGVDFFIVVVGVFIGIQVANWNEQRSFYDWETELLYELRKEAEASILASNQKIHSYQQVVAAGKRSLDFLSSNASCEAECWLILIDFMHASQWQSVAIPKATYESMRSLGLPKDSRIIEAAEAYHAQNRDGAQAFSILPYYRSVVRRLVPIDVQDFYWRNCYSIIDGVETYKLDCAKGATDAIALKAVEEIAQNPEIKPHLTEWISGATLLPISLSSQNVTTERAIAAIDAELGRR